MIRIKTKEVRHLVDATFPDYRRREVVIDARESVTFHDLNWDGGTKSEYRACGIDGSTNDRRLDMGRPAPWANPYEGLTVQIPIDCVIAQCGFFCGRPSTLWLFVNPANMPKFLPAAA